MRRLIRGNGLGTERYNSERDILVWYTISKDSEHLLYGRLQNQLLPMCNERSIVAYGYSSRNYGTVSSPSSAAKDIVGPSAFESTKGSLYTEYRRAIADAR